ncbi:hypothetical protein [Marinobacterium iners]|uniref:hypothetical protein n=1 Tax=Marinobacterium iners TaxID=48076 RepID=UPI001A8D531D|nr:hypothetical protein [Marinobacterium iners]
MRTSTGTTLHSREQHTKVRLIHIQLLLHGSGSRPDFVAHNTATLVLPFALDQLLDGVSVTHAEMRII